MVLHWYCIRFYRTMQNYHALVVAADKEAALALLDEAAALTDNELRNASCILAHTASTVDRPRVVSIVQ